MKKLILVITLMFGINVWAQNGLESTNIFVRVYDLDGKKLGKGKILSISETSVQLTRGGTSLEFPVKDIGLVKTKRSGKHNLLVGAGIGGLIGAIAGAASADPDAWILGYTKAEGAFGGAVLVGTAGALIGAITILFKKSKTYQINGDLLKWQVFTETIRK